MEKNYFAAIEFGSLYNNLLILNYNHNKLDVVALERCRSNGFLNGEIYDEEAFLISLQTALENIYSKFKISLDEVILVLPNVSHKMYSAYVSNKVLTERQIIGKNQIEAIRNQIKNAKVNDGEILVDEVPTAYILDGDRVLRSAPINYQSAILAVRSNIHTLPKKIYEALVKAIEINKVQLLGSELNCNCAAFATANNYELESECIHVNISDDSTTISAFNKNLLIKTSCVNFGINTLVNYLARSLNIDNDYANNLFESYFVCNIDYASDIIFDKENNLSEKRISGITLNRLYNAFNEILETINIIKEECKFNDCKYLLTGALNDYEFFVEEFSKNCNINFIEGNIDVIGIPNQSFVNCYGAIKQFIEKNTDYVLNRLENDQELSYGDSFESNNTPKVQSGGSKFKDIFDD